MFTGAVILRQIPMNIESTRADMLLIIITAQLPLWGFS
jgi:hypothetical protein